MKSNSIIFAAPSGIVADDLTGATDSAVQFARDGWQTSLALAMPSAGTAKDGAVVAVLSDARALPAVAARMATGLAVTGLRDSGAENIFLKIDSTMRGSVAQQITGALESWMTSHTNAVAVVCPSYPAMGRMVVDGHLLVNGQEVQSTAIGIDPVTPVLTSDLRELIPESVCVQLADMSPSENAKVLEAVFTQGARIAVVDASTDGELALLAETIHELGARAIPVGSAGLAVAMSRVWSSGLPCDPQPMPQVNRVVVVVSSLNEVSRGQTEQLVAETAVDRIRVLTPGLDDVLSSAAINNWIARELPAGVHLPEIIVISSPAERPEVASRIGSSTSELIAESLATIAAAVFDATSVDAAVLVGGEGARSVLTRLGAESLLIRYAIREGTPISLIEGGRAHGITVVTKAGGFGEPNSILHIVSELLDTRGNNE